MYPREDHDLDNVEDQVQGQDQQSLKYPSDAREVGVAELADHGEIINKIPLLMTSAQRAMVKNLNEALPQMERLIGWYPWAYNSHATLIVR